MTNFELAVSQAKINGKPILLAFTGSDWCGWCVKLEREVFSQPEFKTWASEHVVLVTADFPEHHPQSDEVKQENAELAKRYGIDSFQTVVLTDAAGREFARTGYRPGGAANYVAEL